MIVKYNNLSVFEYHVDNLFPSIWDGYSATLLVVHCSNLWEMIILTVEIMRLERVLERG